jgi:alpha 1,6-mannosyltransferase
LLLSRALGLACLQFGGVYADMDVECLRPVDEWNAAHGHDAAVLLGAENFDVKRKPHRVHVTNWAMAAMPGHPLLAGFSGVVVREIQKQFFKFADAEGEVTPKAYEAGILDRTGPAALTAAMYDYFEGLGFDLNKVTERDLKSKQGVVAGGVRVLPVVALSSGWEVAEARSKGARYTCEQVGKAKPEALVCHMFWGSWRSTWRTFKQRFTYGSC